MKKLKNQILLVLAILVAGVGTAYAQNFQGIATYQSASSSGGQQIQFKGEGITPAMEKQLADAMKKANQKEFTLNFNLSEANWKEVESLGKGPASGGGSIAVVSYGGGSSGIKYRNTANNIYLEEANLMGKAFLVKDQLKNLAWKLTDETKKIGEYTAQKAVYSKVTQRSMMAFGNDDQSEGEAKTITDTIKVEAWYTPEIPVSHGPDNFWGLPGLILEVNDGRKTLLCTKVVLNPADGVEIKKPRKGKKVNREEYAEIQKAKLEEMSKKYSGGGKGTVFKIGGGNQ